MSLTDSILALNMTNLSISLQTNYFLHHTNIIVKQLTDLSPRNFSKAPGFASSC